MFHFQYCSIKLFSFEISWFFYKFFTENFAYQSQNSLNLFLLTWSLKFVLSASLSKFELFALTSSCSNIKTSTLQCQTKVLTPFNHYLSLSLHDNFGQFHSFIIRSMTSPRQTLSKAVNDALIITRVVEQKKLRKLTSYQPANLHSRKTNLSGAIIRGNSSEFTATLLLQPT